MRSVRIVFPLLGLVLAACSGPVDIDDPGRWVDDGDVRFRVAGYGCAPSTTGGLFPETISRCEARLFLKNMGEQSLRLNAEDQEFGFDDTKSPGYAVTVSEDPNAVNSSGPAPAPGEVPAATVLRGSAEAVVTFYFALPEKAELDFFILSPGTETSYRYEVQEPPEASGVG